ncbi:MAG: hypothetical protein OEZ68_16710 [Gammaproteobacteria bacterium]|nr:hypothetical protein [Gammaproteobacteria bacterium]MDH5802445.1 hypothetical protein [Gammaproteobacteria bacterium]
MAKFERYNLVPDKKGMVWDLLMYVPTVGGLGIGASIMWYSGNQNLTYLLLFLSCFFLFQAVNRIMGRLLLLPGTPKAVEISKQRVVLELRNHQKIELVKNVRYFSDYAGKSFGLTGLDLSGVKKQFVFHKGQFVDQNEFNKIGGQLKVFA